MSDKMREEFEAWVKREWPAQSLSQFNDGEYQGFTVQHCWLAWQASRESLVIELPQGGYFAGYDNEHMMESRDVREAIEAAGLKVKS
jgi:hypothetical protein